MRYCLACRSFSADGPLCTQCGRSFGGRLCKSKKRHLNPTDARFCGECGSTELAEAASYLPLGCISRLVGWAIVAGMIWWVAQRLANAGKGSFTAATGYSNLATWIMEVGCNVVVVLFILHVLTAFIPGETGKQVRETLSKACIGALRLGSRAVGEILRFIGRMLTPHVGGPKRKS